MLLVWQTAGVTNQPTVENKGLMASTAQHKAAPTYPALYCSLIRVTDFQQLSCTQVMLGNFHHGGQRTV